MPLRIGKTAVLLVLVLFLAGCAVRGTFSRPAQSPACVQLSPAQQYAGQVLSYLMRVVLGRAGPADLRAEWSCRGLSAPLDFEWISRVMLEPDRNRSELIVFDTRILGISQVLYHYDPGLNLFKGINGRQSLFPSVELIALRLVLLQKMNRGEKIYLQGLLDRRAMLLDPGVTISDRDLSETGLSEDEMRLIRDAFASDPHLFTYLFCPSMVSALYEIGAVAADSFVSDHLKADTPPATPCRFPAERRHPSPVRIALLPSMAPELYPIRAEGSVSGAVLIDDEAYRRFSRLLKEQILQKARERLGPGRLQPDAVVFSEPPDRPIVVHPENAEAVLSGFCPTADFALVLLGKDVIRCFDLGAQAEAPGRVNRLFIDITDIEHAWIEAEIDRVARFIALRLGVVGGTGPHLQPECLTEAAKPKKGGPPSL